MSNQKYQCGEIVQVLFSDGRIKGESAIVVGAHWCDSKLFFDVTAGHDYTYTGWMYITDISPRYSEERCLRRRPPPADMTFRELMNAANNPPERVR